MTVQINEPDWQVFRRLQPIALERFCERILAEIGRIAADDRKNSHERYLAVYKLIHERDKQLADAFNDSRRSRASIQLGLMRFHGLVTDEEMARFSQDTQERVKVMLQNWAE
jgi:hypothetical protein